MNAHSAGHAPAAHGGHETEDLDGKYAIWAIPFSLLMLLGFLLVVILWVPAAATREMKAKELEGAEAGRQSLLEHRALEAAELGSVEEAMAAVVRERATP